MARPPDRVDDGDVTDVAVRPLEPDDRADVRRIHAAGIATGDAAFETEVPDQAVLDAWLPGHRWVAQVDGRVAGRASAERVSDRIGRHHGVWRDTVLTERRRTD